MEIKFKNLSHTYMINTPFEHRALNDINLHIKSGQFVAIIGHTGSGKSSLIQHMNGLLLPTSGSIQVGDFLIEAKKKNKQLKQLRQLVGMVFQYPEHQLFDETVEKDISFGPINFGCSIEDAKKRVREVLPLVGLSEDVLTTSPFDLSGGQKRRVAIAGVLASKPKLLILDEPTAGLDPIGRTTMMELFLRLHQEEKLTTVLVTHNMEFAAEYADYVIVMDKGTVFMEGTPEEVFQSPKELQEIGLDLPEALHLASLIEKKFQVKLSGPLLKNENVVKAIAALFDTEEM